MGFPRQECWNGLPFPSPEDLPDPEIKPMDSLPLSRLGSSLSNNTSCLWKKKSTLILLNPYFVIFYDYFITDSFYKKTIIKTYWMEKEMATHSSILAWESPWIEEPGGLQSMGLHDWAHVHEGGGRCVGSNELVELKKKKTYWIRMLQKTYWQRDPASSLGAAAVTFHKHMIHFLCR